MDGERSFGIYTYSNGDMYHGGFLHNKKQGRGVVWEKRLMYEVVYDRDVCTEKCLWSLVAHRETARQKQWEVSMAPSIFDRSLRPRIGVFPPVLTKLAQKATAVSFEKKSAEP